MSSAKHVIKLSTINEFCEKKAFEDGENALESGDVEKVNYHAPTHFISGKVHARMRKTVYDVEVTLDANGKIKATKCSCTRSLKCHHMVALLLFAHYNISITDIECGWNVIKTDTAALVQTAEEMFPINKTYRAVDRTLSETEVEVLREKLDNLGIPVGFTWLLAPDNHEDEAEWMPTIEKILASSQLLAASAEEKVNIFKSKCTLEEHLIQRIAEATKGQRTSQNWFLMRKYRITASNFNKVLRAHRKNRFPDSLFKTLLGLYDLDGVKAIQWGVTHERTAICEFERMMGEKVKPSGIWLSKSGILGASPDGLVGDNAIIEVKCPHSYKDKFLTAELKDTNDYIIYFDDVGNVHVNSDHYIYDQIQGLLHIVNRPKCFLVCWTTKETIPVIIEKNETWAPSLKELETFYFTKFLPKILYL